MDSEVVEVLKEIRDEVRGVRDEVTGVRDEFKGVRDVMQSIDGRLQFVEKRLTNGFADLSQKMDNLAKEQTAGFVSIEGVLGRVHAAIVNNVAVLDHERRLTAIEKRQG